MKYLKENIQELIAEQTANWELAAKNYKDLKTVLVKEISFDGFKIKIQFNPGRILSSSAKTDKKTIQKRACFLCEANRPKEQKALPILTNHLILVNPFPIFQQHIIIVSKKHIDQQIKANVENMLQVSKLIQDFTVFYNGPESGASAPDHFHFQAVKDNSMPLNTEIPKLIEKYGQKIANKDCKLWAVDDSLRKMLVFISEKPESITKCFNFVYQLLEDRNKNKEEPPMNVFANFKEGKWQLILILRGEHRPWQYFEKGEKNILITPASVEFGGVLITPLKKDFNKITQKDIISIFQQVSMKKEDFDEIIQQLKISDFTK